MVRRLTQLPFWLSIFSMIGFLAASVQPAYAAPRSLTPDPPLPTGPAGDSIHRQGKPGSFPSGGANRILPGQFGPQTAFNTNYSCSAPIRIMPLGDSITKGSEGLNPPDPNYIGGYRQPVDLTLETDGKNIDFVGSLQSNPTTPPFDTDHEGHSGYTSTDIATYVYSYLSSNPADIVLLHIGTNDVENGSTDPRGVLSILDNIDKYAADHGMTIVKVVAARIIIDLNKPQTTQQFNDNLNAALQARLANDHQLILAYFDNALSYPGDLTSDKIHPDKSGYLKMANVWENALTNLAIPTCFTPLTLTKSTSTPQIHSSSSAQFHITVANTGKAYLYGVNVSDAQTPACARGVGDLAVGASASYDCSSGSITSSFTNVARAIGTVWSDINLVEAGDGSADVHVLSPQISVSAAVQPDIVHAGDPVTITVTLRNSGDSTVDTVKVEDNIAPASAASVCNFSGPNGDSNHDGALQTSEVWTYTCTVTAVDSFVNMVNVTAADKLGGPVSGSASAGVTVIRSSLTLTTSPSAAAVHSGDPITFTTTIRNTGSADLSHLTLTDSLTGCLVGGTFTQSVLHPGSSLDYLCSVIAGTVGITDTVSVTATDTLSRTTTASSNASVDVIFPAVSLDVQPSLVDVSSGNTITFTYVITNKGNDDLKDIVLSDDHCSAVSGPKIQQGPTGLWFTPGSVWVYTCAKKLDGNTVSIVSLSGVDRLGAKFDASTIFMMMRNIYFPMLRTSP